MGMREGSETKQKEFIAPYSYFVTYTLLCVRVSCVFIRC